MASVCVRGEERAGVFFWTKHDRKELTQMFVKRLGFLVIVSLCLAASAMAQSTIFNIPTTDTAAPRAVYFEFDYLIQAPKFEGVDATQVFAPRLVVGVAPNVEAGVNIFNYKYDTAGNFAYFQPNVKWKFYNNDDQGLATAVGAILYTPLNKRTGQDTYGLVYANFSKKVKTSAYGPRFTFGPYGIVGAEDSYIGTKGGAIVGYEQPIHAKASIVADWFSGVSGFGYFTPGVSITLPAASLLNIGYALGNDSYKEPSNKNRFFFVYYGITF
jgi:hypothetical protein